MDKELEKLKFAIVFHALCSFLYNVCDELLGTDLFNKKIKKYCNLLMERMDEETKALFKKLNNESSKYHNDTVKIIVLFMNLVRDMEIDEFIEFTKEYQKRKLS